MSEPLREASPLDKHRGEDAITDFDRQVFQAMAKAMWLPNEFKEYMVQYLALNQPPIPVGQVFGFSQYTVQEAPSITTAQSTNADTYVSLATAGPTISMLPDGKYAIFFGGFAHNDTANRGALMSVDVNAVGALDDDAAIQFAGVSAAYPQGGAGISRVIFKTLSNGGNNTLDAKYRRGNAAGTAQFAFRWMAALRFANP